MYIQAIISPRDVRVTNGSMQSSSRCVNCHSASSVSSSFFFTTPSALMSSMMAYVGDGGMNASLAAMRAGHGGQQKMPHSRLTAFQVMLLPPPLILPQATRIDCSQETLRHTLRHATEVLTVGAILLVHSQYLLSDGRRTIRIKLRKPLNNTELIHKYKTTNIHFRHDYDVICQTELSK